jgi:hypothetical protein
MVNALFAVLVAFGTVVGKPLPNCECDKRPMLDLVGRAAQCIVAEFSRFVPPLVPFGGGVLVFLNQ